MLRPQDSFDQAFRKPPSPGAQASADGLKAARRMMLESGPKSGPIGGQSNTIRGELCELAERLAALLEGPAKGLAHDALGVLQAMVCRIAVVGQVKAGKSSLINALICRPELLPSDVNPWTTAVTRLHFGQNNGGGDGAAEFRFFEADEWHKLAEGGGRIRELTERLVPGFEAAQLVQHLHAMRERAARRLGSEFNQLLGSSHTFSSFDPELLAAYVAAGNSGPHADNSSAGRYSDITKLANLYLDAWPFGFPTTIIDTPGTNDPYLVRDEITRRSLECADVYIVVLTARQALSAADVTLLRILRGLRKERIIIFVNRIDELGNLESDLDAVRLEVERGLRAELGGADVPVVFGSACWAGEALAKSAGDGPAAQALKLRGYADRLLMSPRSDGGAAARPTPTGEPRDLLFLCSGLWQLGREVDLSIQRSHPADVIKHLATSFAELSRLNVLATRDELKSLKSSIEAVMLSARHKEVRMRDLAGELEQLRELGAAIERAVSALEAALTELAESELDALEAGLRDVVQGFAEGECQRLVEAIGDANRNRIWQCDTAPVRHRLEDEFSQRFSYAEARILAAETTILPSLQRTIAHVLPGLLADRRLDLRPTPMRPPSISALGRVVALDLDEPWWKAWWTGRRAPEERLQELNRLIEREFTPITDELVRSAREQVLGQISATVQQANAMCLGIVEQLHRQSEKQIVRLNEIDDASGAAALSSSAGQKFAELDERLKSWSQIHAQLDALKSVCGRLGS